MMKTVQRKITAAYSVWLFAVFLLMVLYLILSGNIFYTYADALPWIVAYIVLAVLGNIAMLVAMYKYLIPDKKSLQYVAIYEVIFVIVVILSFLIIYMQWLPSGGIGNVNFETLLNAVLPFMFILLILDEFILSKALRMMCLRG
ncbi:MAG: hypothetical protein LBE57_01925 [Methanosarcinales archaeon]|jgi:hypothetical protein|nr:hypothetical protein [Methanosarcinales archaeon]